MATASILSRVTAPVAKPDITGASRDDLAEVQRQLDEDPTSVNAVEEVTGDTALTWAAGRGNTEMVSVLLKVDDIAVNQANAIGQTALMHSSMYDDERNRQPAPQAW